MRWFSGGEIENSSDKVTPKLLDGLAHFGADLAMGQVGLLLALNIFSAQLF